MHSQTCFHTIKAFMEAMKNLFEVTVTRLRFLRSFRNDDYELDYVFVPLFLRFVL